MITLAISLGFTGKLNNDIYKAWKSLDKNFKINNIKNSSTHPHITLIVGDTKNIKQIYKVLKNLKIKKFKLKSPGLAIFANTNLNLYVRWERNIHLMNCFDLIRSKTKKLIYKPKKKYNLTSWVPRSCIAWKDFNYSQMASIKKKIGYLFKTRSVIINRIYLIKVTTREVLKYTIKIN